MSFAGIIATWFGVGKLPKAPGTWGSLAALPYAYGMYLLGGLEALILATLVVFIIGLWASAAYMRITGRHDPGEIVVDEVAGMMLALWPLSFGGDFRGELVLAAFLLFRLFDIFKPWPVSWADQQPGAFGVMFDDILAGMYAAILIGGLLWIRV